MAVAEQFFKSPLRPLSEEHADASGRAYTGAHRYPRAAEVIEEIGLVLIPILIFSVLIDVVGLARGW